MELGIDGCVAVVTDAASGNGFAVAKQLCAEGAKVVLCDQHEDALTRGTSSLESANVWHYRADVTKGVESTRWRVPSLSTSVSLGFGALRRHHPTHETVS